MVGPMMGSGQDLLWDLIVGLWYMWQTNLTIARVPQIYAHDTTGLIQGGPLAG
jgi:hypothetical protein